MVPFLRVFSSISGDMQAVKGPNLFGGQAEEKCAKNPVDTA
jgi:hypothetical protein